MLHSRLLYHFLIVSKKKSISAAAREIGVTQPALTRSVKRLEAILGVSLLERRPNGVILTPEGQIMARRVSLMNLEYQHALAEISDRNQGIKGRLRLSAGPVWISELLPPIIQEFHILYPEVRVSLMQGGFETQFEKLLSGSIDAMCGTLDFPNHAEIIKEHILDLRHTVIARSDHPLILAGRASPQDLASYPWVVLAEDTINNTRIGSYFVAHSLEPPNIAVETTTLGSLSLLRNSNFLTTFAIQGVETLQAFGLEAVIHDGTFWEFPAGISRRRSSKPSPSLRAFRGLLLATLGKQKSL